MKDELAPRIRPSRSLWLGILAALAVAASLAVLGTDRLLNPVVLLCVAVLVPVLMWWILLGRRFRGARGSALLRARLSDWATEAQWSALETSGYSDESLVGYSLGLVRGAELDGHPDEHGPHYLVQQPRGRVRGGVLVSHAVVVFGLPVGPVSFPVRRTLYPAATRLGAGIVRYGVPPDVPLHDRPTDDEAAYVLDGELPPPSVYVVEEFPSFVRVVRFDAEAAFAGASWHRHLTDALSELRREAHIDASLVSDASVELGCDLRAVLARARTR